jgi:predicted DNA-binding protein
MKNMSKKMTARMEPFMMPETLKERLYKYSEDCGEPKAMVLRKALTQYLEKVGA